MKKPKQSIPGRLILALLISCFTWGQRHLLAQQTMSFQNYSSEHGLSQLSCYALAQDAAGFIWVGTQDGLNRYDGREFKVYAQQNERGKHLPSNAIFALYFDRVHDLLWTGTSRGMCVYVPSGDSLAKFSDFFPFAAQIQQLPIKKITSFHKNEYWVLTYNRGLYCINTASRKLQAFFAEPENQISVTDITLHQGKIIVSMLYSLYEMCPGAGGYYSQPLHDGYRFPQIEAITSYQHKLWVGTISHGLYHITGPIEKPNNIAASDIVFGGVFCFNVDRYNQLWIGSRGSGIYKYNASTGRVTRAQHNQFISSSPATNFVVFFLEDRQGNMWCGLSGGLSKYDPLSHQFEHVNGPTSLNGSLLDKVIYSMYRTKDGVQFIGTQNKGLFEWRVKTKEFLHFPESAVIGNANNVIYHITEDDRGDIWAATCGGLMHLDRKSRKITYYPEKKTPFKLNKMYAVTKLKKRDSLLISADDGLHFFALKQKKWVAFSQKPEQRGLVDGFAAFRGGRYFYEDDHHTLWLCASGSGLIRYDYLDDRLLPVSRVNEISPSVRHLLADGSRFLLATDNGLIVYDRQKDKVLARVNMQSSSISNVCYAIQKDRQGFYWISTNAGLCKVNQQYRIVQTYNAGNGLTFLEYNTACSGKDPDGTLYFGGMGGITFFRPETLRPNEYSPQPVVTAIRVNEMIRTLPSQHLGDILLNHNENFITIQFAVTNFSNEKNNLFSYRLVGLNNQWSPPQTENNAHFTSLPPGKYFFELKSANSDGKWSNSGRLLAISIRAPWWGSWWFRGASLLLLSGLVACIIRRREQAIKKEANLIQKTAEAEMTALRAQMNPHFVFNSLNSIREMMLCNESRQASHFLGKFAGLIRTTLDHSGKPFISLGQTIDHLKRYLEMEQLRNGEFTSKIWVDDSLDPNQLMIPSMLIQPFVENALWHGISAGHRNIHIRIEFKTHHRQLLCVVEDNGMGIRQSLRNKASGSKVHHSVGIENIVHRIGLLNEKYKLNSNIQIHDKTDLDGYDGPGTVVHLLLPLQIDQL